MGAECGKALHWHFLCRRQENKTVCMREDEKENEKARERRKEEERKWKRGRD